MITKDSSVGDTRYLPVTRVLKQGDEYKVAARFIDILREWIDKDMALSLDYALSETMENVFCHAQTDQGLWIHVQKYEITNKIEVCLADLGRGIPKSLSDNPCYANLPEYIRFIKALEVGVTRSPYSNHSGEGLSATKEWIRLEPSAEGIVLSSKYGWGKFDTKECLFKNLKLFGRERSFGFQSPDRPKSALMTHGIP